MLLRAPHRGQVQRQSCPQLADFCLQAFIFEGLKVSARGEKAGAGDLRKRTVVARRQGTQYAGAVAGSAFSGAGGGVDQRDPVTAGGGRLAVVASAGTDHVADVRGVGQQHDQAVDADAAAAGGRAGRIRARG